MSAIHIQRPLKVDFSLLLKYIAQRAHFFPSLTAWIVAKRMAFYFWIIKYLGFLFLIFSVYKTYAQILHTYTSAMFLYVCTLFARVRSDHVCIMCLFFHILCSQVQHLKRRERITTTRYFLVGQEQRRVYKYPSPETRFISLHHKILLFILTLPFLLQYLLLRLH